MPGRERRFDRFVNIIKIKGGFYLEMKKLAIKLSEECFLTKWKSQSL